MGRLFVDFHGGRGLLYLCKCCGTYLTSHGELTSPNFNGSTGPALLFRKVWNVEMGNIERRKMTTGWHVVRDVACIICKSRLGWMYEMAYDPTQEYKEGQYILECELICRENAIGDPLGADEDGVPPREITFERPAGRVRNRNRHWYSSSSGRSGSESSESNNSLSSLTSRSS